jgi:hypothetical protein
MTEIILKMDAQMRLKTNVFFSLARLYFQQDLNRRIEQTSSLGLSDPGIETYEQVEAKGFLRKKERQ